ncbi:hypothetical protein LTS09_017131 [Friedmanniomyces endolithicus]|nr:hypothetical protein LTS09_017131 [Friedmanniomyces endolithicus]
MKDLPDPPAELSVQTPVTPLSAGAVTALQNLIKKDAHLLDVASQQRLQRRLEKLTNATQLSFAGRALLQEQNRFLTTVNNEAKVRRTTKTEIIGKARGMSYEDLEKARRERAAKEAEKEARKAEKQTRAMSKTRREHDEDGQNAGASTAQPNGDIQEGAVAPEPWRGPVAKMW